MEMMHKLFFRRFSTEEFKQFKEIYREETKKLRKRVQFIVGIILLAALMFYFLFRAFDLQWPSSRELAASVAGAAAGVFIIWLGSRFSKLNKLSKTHILILFGMFFLIFILITVASSSRVFEWEYLVYALIILVGVICLNDSIREYFCERLLREQQKQH